MEYLGELGYLGLFIGTFLAATILLFSSDVIMVGILLAGADPILALIVATMGNWLGGLTTYYVGYLGKWEWIEKWFKITEEKLVMQKHRIDKYGSIIAFLSWTPFIGDIMVIGLGFYRVNFIKSAIYMFLGKAMRFAFWVIMFHYYGQAVLDYKFF